MKKYFFIVLLFARIAFAHNYVAGEGSEFKMSMAQGSANLSIYVTESTFNKLSIEYFISANNGLMSVQTWQQFQMGLTGASLSLESGYILGPGMTKPEIMSSEFMHNNSDGVDVTDFFFNKTTELDKDKIGIETIEVPAGSISTTHYKKIKNGQTLDFWISDKAGAIGLVKLISKGSTNKDQDYTIELMSLLKNVKPKINPKDAVPLTDKGRMFLAKPKN